MNLKEQLIDEDGCTRTNCMQKWVLTSWIHFFHLPTADGYHIVCSMSVPIPSRDIGPSRTQRNLLRLRTILVGQRFSFAESFECGQILTQKSVRNYRPRSLWAAHKRNLFSPQFLTTFILSLLKAIDIRSESAIKLLAEFLDMDRPYTEGGRFPNAEHFAHGKYPTCIVSSFECYDQLACSQKSSDGGVITLQNSIAFFARLSRAYPHTTLMFRSALWMSIFAFTFTFN